MKAFDHQHRRKILDDEYIGYLWRLSRPFDENAREGALASSASDYLDTAIQCILVGYDTPALQLLERARDWLTYAIVHNERPRVYSKGGTEAAWHHKLALCNWLLNNQHDSGNFRDFVIGEEHHLSHTHLQHDEREISLVLPHYVDAGAYEQAIARYHGAGLSPPASLGAITTEGQMSYVLSRRLLGRQYGSAELCAAFDRFLNRSVPDWLLWDGQWSRAAEWMKIRHWNGVPGAGAVEALMKCYDYIPGSIPPADRR